MKILDLFCGAGGAGEGYHRAGFTVTGVDIIMQPEYPHRFVQADALDYAAEHWREYDAIHASPPCQVHSVMKSLHNKNYIDLVPDTRELLRDIGLPYIIENVPGAPLIDPVVLCGSMFGLIFPDIDGKPLKLLRHRLFESNMPIIDAGHCEHDHDAITATVIGTGGDCSLEYRDRPGRGTYMPGLEQRRGLMGMPWASRPGISQAIPPVYTEFLGRQLLALMGDSRIDCPPIVRYDSEATTATSTE